MPKLSKDTVEFNQEAKHGRLRFGANERVKFEDPDAAPYFVACGWAVFATSEANARFVSIGEIDIDPNTIQNESGLLVTDLIAKSEG